MPGPITLSTHTKKKKLIQSDDSFDRVLAEFEGMTAVSRAIPHAAPRPLGYGKCRDSTGSHFLVMEFLHMVDAVELLPDPAKLAAVLSQLHRAISPTGKFGFHVVPYDGMYPVSVGKPFLPSPIFYPFTLFSSDYPSKIWEA